MSGDFSTRIGLWSSIAVAVLVAAFGASLVAGLPLAYSFAAAFFLAPAFVTMLVCLTSVAPPDRRIWGQLGAAFAVIYAVMVCATYYLQLALVGRADPRIADDALAMLEFRPGSALFAIDMLGYGFMTLSTLAAAPVFAGRGLEVWLRGWFIAHGLLGVPTILTPILIAGADPTSSDRIGTIALIAWSVFFLPLAVMTAIYFTRLLGTRPTSA